MFIQTVIQATMRRMRRSLPPPPLPGERHPQHKDRSAWVVGLVVVFTLLAVVLLSSIPSR